MTKIVNRKNLLISLLVLVLLPISMGLFCHCCEASQTTQTVIKATPCHHCCTSLNPGQQCEAPSIKKFVLTPVFSWAQTGFEILRTALFYQPLDLQGLDSSPPGIGNTEAFPLQTPVYLAIQVLRI